MRACLAFWMIYLCTVVDAQPLRVSVRAQKAILINPANGAILYQKGADAPHYPASILKLATALYIIDGLQIELDQEIIASKQALQVVPAADKQADFRRYPAYLLEHDAKVMGLKVGQAYTVRTLLHGLLLASANDAANVLAEGVAGFIDLFMEGLNGYLKAQGVQGTQFQNPSGLHHPAQITTAADMAQIATLCFSNPTVCQILKTLVYTCSDGSDIRNFMLKKGGEYYPALIGGKTGYTASAGYNLVAAAQHKGRWLIVVLLGCEKGEDRFKDASTLFETAFNERREQRTLCVKDGTTYQRVSAKGRPPLSAALEEDVVLSIYPAEEMEYHAEIMWDPCPLPILEGDEVGKLVVRGETGVIVASHPLFASGDVLREGGRWDRMLMGVGVAFLMGAYLFKKRCKRC